MRVGSLRGGESALPHLISPGVVPSLVDAFLTATPMHAPQSLVPTVLVFDSGLGGLTVFREIARARPEANYVYVADDALFPYAAVEERRLTTRIVGLMEALIASHAPDLVVIACNTASTIALPALRARFDLPFVGTVPAIKPACAASLTKRVSVLGTQATVGREYTRALVEQYAAGCAVTLVGSSRLAEHAEAELAGVPADDDALRAEIAPCFVDEAGARTDTVVLACTHYPLLLARFERLAPWPVRWIDPAAAIARRVVDLVGPPIAGRPPSAARAVFTSGRLPSPALVEALARHGLRLNAPAAV